MSDSDQQGLAVIGERQVAFETPSASPSPSSSPLPSSPESVAPTVVDAFPFTTIPGGYVSSNTVLVELLVCQAQIDVLCGTRGPIPEVGELCKIIRDRVARIQTALQDHPVISLKAMDSLKKFLGLVQAVHRLLQERKPYVTQTLARLVGRRRRRDEISPSQSDIKNAYHELKESIRILSTPPDDMNASSGTSDAASPSEPKSSKAADAKLADDLLIEGAKFGLEALSGIASAVPGPVGNALGAISGTALKIMRMYEGAKFNQVEAKRLGSRIARHLKEVEYLMTASVTTSFDTSSIEGRLKDFQGEIENLSTEMEQYLDQRKILQWFLNESNKAYLKQCETKINDALDIIQFGTMMTSAAQLQGLVKQNAQTLTTVLDQQRNKAWVLQQAKDRQPTTDALAKEYELPQESIEMMQLSKTTMRRGGRFVVQKGLMTASGYTGEVALKIRNDDKPDGREGLRFNRMLAISHSLEPNVPNLLRVLGWWKNGEDRYIVTSWMQNGDVTMFLGQHPSLPDDQRMAIIGGIAVGLNALHRENIVHGNIQPTSILIDNDNRTPLIGNLYGAKHLDPLSANQVTGNGSGLDDHRYLEVDVEVPELYHDIFGWARSALFIISGKQPYPNAVSRNSIVSASRKDPGYDDYKCALLERYPDLWQLLERCWSRQNPQDRPTIGAVLEALARFAEKP